MQCLVSLFSLSFSVPVSWSSQDLLVLLLWLVSSLSLCSMFFINISLLKLSPGFFSVKSLLVFVYLSSFVVGLGYIYVQETKWSRRGHNEISSAAETTAEEWNASFSLSVVFHCFLQNFLDTSDHFHPSCNNSLRTSFSCCTFQVMSL